MIKGNRKKGGRASVAIRPHSSSAVLRRQPEDSEKARASAAWRSSIDLRRVNPHFADAALVRLQDFEAQASGVAHQFALGRDMAELEENQAAQRVELSFLVRSDQLQAQLFFQHIDADAGAGLENM